MLSYVSKNFWRTIRQPIFALAPMADVTDTAFRQMFASLSKPDVMFTEFVSTDGLCSEGRKNVLRELKYKPIEHPIVAQIWGTDPAKFEESARLIESLGFDGIDINMGCPQRKEIVHGACAALIRNPDLAKQIIAATKRGASGLPVSVKTRLGYDTVETETWVGHLLDAEPDAIIIHARTKSEMSNVPAHWDEVGRAVELRNRRGSKMLILGNGDIKSLEEGDLRIAETGLDGVMIGRGAFGNPWFFSRSRSRESVSLADRLGVMLEHARLFEEEFEGEKNFAVMRKHFKAYVTGFPGAHELRANLMSAVNATEVQRIIEDFLKNNKSFAPNPVDSHAGLVPVVFNKIL